MFSLEELQKDCPFVCQLGHPLAIVSDVIVSLPRGRIQEFTRASHAWFIFNLKPEISSFIDYMLQYLHVVLMPHSTQPLAYHYPVLLTWRTNFVARDGDYPSTLVSGLPTTAPPFASPPTLSRSTVQVTLFT